MFECPTWNMSTAIMPQNTMFDFGDSMLKTSVSDAAPGSHLAIGSTMRLALTRMASQPGQNSLAMFLNNVNSAAAAAAVTGSTTTTNQHRRLERAQSAPGPAPSAVPLTTSTIVNTSRYKTELCRPYEEFGVCKYGDKCQFAHGGAELRSLARHPKYKTELCRTYHTIGFCPYGMRCHFVHNQDEVVGPKAPLVAARSVPAAVRSRPAALSPALSLDSPSPPASLSQSPTSSMGSFFSSEPELHSPGAISNAPTATVVSLDEQRLPVFNRLSATQILTLRDLI